MKTDYTWHRSLNEYNQVGSAGFRHWMYEAKRLKEELPRLARLFKAEREGTLRKTHKQCSMSPITEVDDNHLTCCIGVECRSCPHLLSLKAESPEALDEAKAFTCASHILHLRGAGNQIDTSEGYILTQDDKIFWHNVYESMSNFRTIDDRR